MAFANQPPANGKTALWTDYLDGLLLVCVTPALPITMTIFLLSLLLLAWAVLPSIVFEVKPEWAENAATKRIRSAGEWLSRGIDNTAVPHAGALVRHRTCSLGIFPSRLAGIAGVTCRIG